jgi:carboxyl-terminal processing protease
MKKFAVLMSLLLGTASLSQGAGFEKYSDWKDRPEEKFAEGEANFKLTMDKLLQEYMEKGVSKEDLYRAATAGMLESLNSGEHSWNTLLTPKELKELQSDLSGQVSGIGIALKFDKETGNAQILNVIANTPAAKAGLKNDDQILSVDGKRYKGMKFHDVVSAIRGKVGESISLKVLREDKILNLKIKREAILWSPVELSKLNASTQLLTISYFTGDTPKVVEEKVRAVNASGAKNLIIDLRDNSGGGFEKAVQTAELFIPKDKTIVSTKDRDGKLKTYTSKKGLLDKDIKVVLLTNAETSSGAELFIGALKDEARAKTVGEKTLGKWNVQSIQNLSNGFAIKYSVMSFQSPGGISYQNVGIKPDIEVALPEGVEPLELRAKHDIQKQLELDSQLKAATELVKAI